MVLLALSWLLSALDRAPRSAIRLSPHAARVGTVRALSNEDELSKLHSTAERIATALERIAVALEGRDRGNRPSSEPATSAPAPPERASRVDWQSLSDDVYLEQLQEIGLDAESSDEKAAAVTAVP